MSLCMTDDRSSARQTAQEENEENEEENVKLTLLLDRLS